jgi:hypothetical protein
MKATRLQFASIFEWLLAAAVVAAVLAAGSVVFREMRAVRAVMPVIAGAARTDDVPAGIPPRAVSVPVLLLDRGKAVHIGERLSDVEARLGSEGQAAADVVDREGPRERLIRAYDYAGAHFVLVFELADRTTEQRVAAIYVR